jgi:hypothetical protein
VTCAMKYGRAAAMKYGRDVVKRHVVKFLRMS